MPDESSIGQSLRNRRLQKNLTLEESSDALRVQVKFLKALEDEHWHELPARVYCEGFLKKYSDFLGLDGQAMVEQFRRDSVEGDKPGFTHPRPVPEAVDNAPFFQIRLPLVLLGLAFLILIAFYFVRRQERPSAAPSMALHQVDDMDLPLPSTATALPATPAPAVSSHEASLKAKDLVWLRVWLDGAVRYEGTLVTGETRKWTFQKQIRLRSGNISRVSLNVDGLALGLPSSTGPMEILWPAPADIPPAEGVPAAARFVARPVASRPARPVQTSTITAPTSGSPAQP